ncbi:MAG: ABC transporter substrate-binding protein [Acetobacteraceae bacterium]
MRRRTLLKTAAASLLAAPAIAQPAKTAHLALCAAGESDGAGTPSSPPQSSPGNHGYYVFDTLYSNPMDGQPRPQMAEGHEISADGRTWRIRLREGLKFHDNSPVRAVDCVASIQRWSKRDPFGQLVGKVVGNLGRAGRPHSRIEADPAIPAARDRARQGGTPRSHSSCPSVWPRPTRTCR